ncbi:Glycoside hydrolase, catalytic domain-containing protein [Cynara cardunculus var. scolymus]|uniref:Glycoside hydrolase, catalytic domain-containing protein n=1 Tax=Cynara cardunculus var. scolymus TaxID=59895 RepID=A0A103YAG5_CYNCS|nr:Glycoside hydrolase, catalytic domain-containing protein [Cynara cardunculus var. scolymus]
MLIDSRSHGIEPYVTLYHWDLPQALADKYNGWLDTRIIDDFVAYANTCFEKFGDRVKNWMTFNEPHTFTVQGYDVGLQAPGRCSILLGLFCRAGNSATEPYIVGHNAKQKGRIGIAFDAIWYVPGTNKTEDIEAAQRVQEFQLGWFLDPIMFGDYPSSMRTRVGNRLPKFSKVQSALIKGSIDFVGVNHYTTWYAWHNSTNLIGALLNDSLSDSGSLTLRMSSENISFTFSNPIHGKTGKLSEIGQIPYGMDDPNSPFIPLKVALMDEKRVKYHNDYLTNLLAAIKEDGCNVKGYFAWSLLDNWEWGAGFSSRFGLFFVDYDHNLKRYAKNSAIWFKNFLTSG